MLSDMYINKYIDIFIKSKLYLLNNYRSFSISYICLGIL